MRASFRSSLHHTCLLSLLLYPNWIMDYGLWITDYRRWNMPSILDKQASLHSSSSQSFMHTVSSHVLPRRNASLAKGFLAFYEVLWADLFHCSPKGIPLRILLNLTIRLWLRGHSKWFANSFFISRLRDSIFWQEESSNWNRSWPLVCPTDSVISILHCFQV